MKKLTALLIFTLIAINLLLAQPTDKDAAIAEEINQNLWKPFKEAWTNRDAKAFNDLHTDDILRVSSRGIRMGEDYKASIVESYSKPDAADRVIDFWMEHRVYSDNIGYEVGYYRITVNQEDGQKKYYARFHVVLKKVDGQWKIAQDWDTSTVNGEPVDEEEFAKGTPLQL